MGIINDLIRTIGAGALPVKEKISFIEQGIPLKIDASGTPNVFLMGQSSYLLPYITLSFNSGKNAYVLAAEGELISSNEVRIHSNPMGLPNDLILILSRMAGIKLSIQILKDNQVFKVVDYLQQEFSDEDDYVSKMYTYYASEAHAARQVWSHYSKTK